MQKLEEFKDYEFKILKTVDTPDGMFYVLEDPFGFRHLLTSEFYPPEKYSFEIGSLINCQVDKINCKGQIFLEPRHPKFEAGNTAEFILFESEDSWQTELYTAEDSEKKKWNAIFETDIALKFPLKSIFKIEKIKKGKLYLKK
jgi:hypothetical protein